MAVLALLSAGAALARESASGSLAEVCPPDFLLHTLDNPSPESGDAMGYSVAIAGNLVVAGAPYDSPGGVSNAGSAYVFDATTGMLLASLINPDPTVDDFFGWSVAIDGDIAVVGAFQDDPAAPVSTGAGAGAQTINGGTAFVFNATTGALLHSLTRPVPTDHDAFGRSVAISGTRIVVGADLADPGGVNFAGAAYLFDAETGGLLTTFSKPSPAERDLFGWSVAIDGDTVVVGAYGEDVGGTLRVGRAYVFDAASGSLISTLSNPEVDQDDYFGMTVAVSGGTVLVGAYGQPPAGTRTAGTVYIFDAATGGLQRTFTSTNSEPDSRFGSSVAIEGGVGVLGGYGHTREVTIFDVSTGGLLGIITPPPPFGGGFFGDAVAISGSHVVAAQHQEDLNYGGTAYLFGCPPPPTDSPTPSPSATPSPSPTPTPIRTPSPVPTATPIPCLPDTLSQTLNAPIPQEYANFGYSVAVSGTTAIVGAYNESTGAPPAGGAGVIHGSGAAYLINAGTGGLLATIANPAPGSGDSFGWSGAIDRGYAVAGALYDAPDGETRTGTAYVFQTEGGLLQSTLTNPAAGNYDYFGWSVGIEGDLVVVGAPGTTLDGKIYQVGAAYVFDAPSGALLATLQNPAPAIYDQFGQSVAISGGLAVVGAPYDNPDGLTSSGAVHIFDAMTGELVRTLENPTPNHGDVFGWSVAIYGNRVIVGAKGDNPGDFSFAGTAYVFDVLTGDLVTTLNKPSPAYNDEFGVSVGLFGDTAVVGASLYGIGELRERSGGVSLPMNGEGAAYVFNATSGDLLATLSNPAPGAYEYYAGSLSISGNILVIGAGYDNLDPIYGAGSAYVFSCTPSGATPTGSPSPTPTQTDSPTPTPTPSPTPTAVGTPVISFDIVIGYRPANDRGRGHVRFTDSAPSPDLRSYVVEFRRTNRFGVIFQQAFSLDAPPGASETFETEFDLPLNEPDNPLSYEVDLQYRVVGFTGQGGGGLALYQSPLAYAKHPSARLESSITLTNPPVAPGNEAFSMSDARPTAQIGTLQYDIVRTVPGAPGETVLATLDHGYPGPAIVAKVWPAVTRTGTLAVIPGPQIITIHARHTYSDSGGNPLGRHDVAPPSPPLVLGDIGQISARIAEYLRTGSGDAQGLDLNEDGVVDIADLLLGLASGR